MFELSSTGSQTDRTGRTSQVDMKPAVQSLDHVGSLLISTGRDVDHRKRSRCFDKPLSHYRKYLVLLGPQECRRRMALWRS